MPLLHSDYKAPWWLFNGHLQTIYPALFRSLPQVQFERERITTADDDFLDLDWSRVKGAITLVLISHGLEGCSDTQYAKGMVEAANQEGYDALVWNFRGCSGVINKQLKYYHSGETGDLHTVIQHAIECGYKDIVLIGFSVGGNITLKYLGEQHQHLMPQIRKAVVFSVPTDLADSAAHLTRWSNRIYLKRFLKSLYLKIKLKAEVYPEQLSVVNYGSIKDFHDFDSRYTAPINGFSSAEEYWRINSSKFYLAKITIPTLIVTANNDPFFTAACLPTKIAKQHPLLYLEITQGGGHCGFATGFRTNTRYWSEQRAMDFVKGDK